MKRFYLVMAILGTVLPWFFVLRFFGDVGIDVPGFIFGLFANDPAAGLTTDFLITSFVFWVWASIDARQHGINNWWIIIPLNLGIGLSLAFPLYLFMREARAETKA